MCGKASISKNNRKTCCNCGRSIRIGDFCWQVQQRSGGDGTRHICESCAELLTQARMIDVMSSRISGAVVRTPNCKCARCKTDIPRGDRAGFIRIRPEHTVVNRGVVSTVSRKKKICYACLDEIQQEIKVYRYGIDVYEAARYLTGNSVMLKEVAMEALNGVERTNRKSS